MHRDPRLDESDRAHHRRELTLSKLRLGSGMGQRSKLSTPNKTGGERADWDSNPGHEDQESLRSPSPVVPESTAVAVSRLAMTTSLYAAKE
jgi:hypothetical protein